MQKIRPIDSVTGSLEFILKKKKAIRKKDIYHVVISDHGKLERMKMADNRQIKLEYLLAIRVDSQEAYGN